MLKTLYKTSLLSIAAAIGIFSASQANASSNVKVGMLVCNSQGSIGKIVMSSQTLSCVFQTNGKNAKSEKYAGEIKQYGLDIGVKGKGQMSWMVLATSNNSYQPGVLDGDYSGINVDASVGVGAGSKLLVGKGKSFALQPLSVEAHSGANLAVGVAKLTLIAEPVQAATAAKHAKKPHAKHHKNTTAKHHKNAPVKHNTTK